MWFKYNKIDSGRAQSSGPIIKNRDIPLKIFRFSLFCICLDDTWWFTNDIPCTYALLMLKMPNFRLFKKIRTTLNQKV